jgi:DNA-binding NarL/FixJ family response regulator
MAAKVLIVDDNPVIRHSLRSSIDQNPQWKVCDEAENGAIAIDKVKQLDPDVVILDLSMPIMNGLDAARVIRGIAPKVYILLFTVHTSPQLSAIARQVGVNEVVSKFDVSKLLGALRSGLAAFCLSGCFS